MIFFTLWQEPATKSLDLHLHKEISFYSFNARFWWKWFLNHWCKLILGKHDIPSMNFFQPRRTSPSTSWHVRGGGLQQLFCWTITLLDWNFWQNCLSIQVCIICSKSCIERDNTILKTRCCKCPWGAACITTEVFAFQMLWNNINILQHYYHFQERKLL